MGLSASGESVVDSWPTLGKGQPIMNGIGIEPERKK